MPMIGAAAAAQHIQIAQAPPERGILIAQLGWIAAIQRGRLVQ